MQTYERVIALDGAHNVRDLGGYATGAGGLTRWRSLLRGDALHGLSAADIEALVAQDVTTVIDLRSAIDDLFGPVSDVAAAYVQDHRSATGRRSAR